MEVFTRVVETASYVPETIRTNKDCVEMVGDEKTNPETGTSEEWIESCTGILERRIAQDWETQHFMAKNAVGKILEKVKVPRREISIILAGNTHPAHLTPALPVLIPCKASEMHYQLQAGNTPAFDAITDDLTTAAWATTRLLGSTLIVDKTAEHHINELKQQKRNSIIYHHRQKGLAQIIAEELNMDTAGSYDVVTGCASYNYGLALADATIKAMPQYIIVVGVDKMLQITNPKDRRTVVLFGELASATLLGPSPVPGFMAHKLEMDSSLKDAICIKDGSFWQNGRAVYAWAVRKVLEYLQVARQCAEPPVAIPHQANPSMLGAIRAHKDYPPIRDMIVTGDRFGNCSTASVPHAFDVALQTERIRQGDEALFIAMGAGASSGYNRYRHVL
jgi:3-oxoacyl-[acyl-carrier-protein] synthase-3